MTSVFDRRLNYWALMGTLFVAIGVNSAGAALGWWPGSVLSAAPMLAVAYAVGWLSGKPVAEPAS